MNLTLATIAAGSSGNSSIVISGNTVIMSDCGISFKKASSGLSALGLSAPDAILISHSHSDHIGGALTVARKYDIPIYMSAGTKKECPQIPDEYITAITADQPFCIGGIEITPFEVSHDTASPLAFTFNDGKSKAAVMTDTGIVTKKMLSAIKGSESIIIESNHDEELLFNGPYPYFLKKRISGNKGHMSNKLCASVCKFLSENGTRKFMLAHLSEHNNTKELAFSCTDSILKNANISYTLKLAEKDTPLFL